MTLESIFDLIFVGVGAVVFIGFLFLLWAYAQGFNH